MKRRRRQNTGDSPPYLHSSRNSHTSSYSYSRDSHTYSYSHMCSQPCNSYNLLLCNRHPEPTPFPRSTHLERGDDTLSKIETSGARCRYQPRNQTTNPKLSAGTCTVTIVGILDLLYTSIHSVYRIAAYIHELVQVLLGLSLLVDNRSHLVHWVGYLKGLGFFVVFDLHHVLRGFQVEHVEVGGGRHFNRSLGRRRCGLIRRNR